MAAVALLCVVAGTWQISRYEQTARENDVLKGNAHTAAVPLTTAVVPLVGHGPTPSRNAIRFRTVTADGTYVPGFQQFVRDQTQDGTSGLYVLNAFRTATGTLLVVRGFVPDGGRQGPPTVVAPPPAAAVRIEGRLQTTGNGNDGAAELTDSEIESVNPTQQAARSGLATFNTYAILKAGQPGTAGLAALPEPDLSNPAGGAGEAQHLAYIIQWYAFALLALAAPFVIARAELRDAQQRFLGIDQDAGTLGISADGLTASLPRSTALSPVAGAGVAVRGNGALDLYSGATPEQWQRAARLAKRYGRSIGIDALPPAQPTSADLPSARPPVPGPKRPDAGAAGAEPTLFRPAADSSTRPHRSPDAYHGSYNDYLWQLAMADGGVPLVSAEAGDDQAREPKPTILANGADAGSRRLLPRSADDSVDPEADDTVEEGGSAALNG